ncbi:MAG TPA: alpha-(1-_3)-arabinofuranosyltransferase family protein [Thermoleophilaceae bacterium]|nr:alpha-(1->3)-arabinofuranosyltransferase family protein [Thermoleophilaceae bacterium]
MPSLRSSRLLSPALAALAFLLAFLQRPGDAYSDTRLELSADPSLFLARVGDVWSSTTDLGHVQSGQFVGYLFPMGPWFAAADALGVSVWLAQRLWLGLLLALAAWGAVRLMDELYRPERGLAHVVAGLFFMLNPYTVIFTSRGTITLLAYAALPWLMLAAHRGLASPRGWRWPVGFALILSLAGGGVNAGVIAWALVAPAALLVYEAAVLRRSWREIWSFAWRTGLLAGIASAWWAVPVLLQGPYGEEFLSFTEQPGTIWGTASLSESLRLLGFWVMYVGVGFGVTEPFLPAGPTYLFNEGVIVGSFLAPLLAFGGVLLTRRWRYAPFFVLLAIGALLVMFAGFPNGTPFRRFLLFAYEHAQPLQFLRTTYKIAPLLALSMACLAGAAAASLAGRRRWLAVPALLVPFVFGAPLVTGDAVDERQAYGEVPAHWRAAIADADRDTPHDRRVAVLPGELFGYYRWGDTMDPIGPALSRRPLLVREIVPYADRRSSQFQEVADDLVQQDRLVPGQLERLLRLMGASTVLVPTDGRPERSGALDPARAERALAGEPWLHEPAGSYGRRLPLTPARGWGGRTVALPELRRFRIDGAESAVRAHPLGGVTVLDGDAHGIAALAAQRALPAGALRYAGDLSPAELRQALERGGTLVLTDSNRRRVVNSARLRLRYGPTLGPEDAISPDSPTFELFDRESNDRRTLALYSGLRALESPIQAGQAIFPEHRPFAAVDGDRSTSWLADKNLDADQRWLELRFRRPLDARTLRLYPHSDPRGVTASVRVSENGGGERAVAVDHGWNEIELSGRPLRSLRIRIGKVRGRERGRGGGGIDELELPGLDVRETLRLPVEAAREASGADLSHSAIEVLLERTTADFPHRAGADVGVPQARSPLDAVDPERGLARRVTLPEPRSFELGGWASVDPSAPDYALDRLAGDVAAASARMRSSSRFEGVPSNRASSAFDGDPDTAWVGDRLPGRHTWIEWQTPRPVRLTRLRLVPGPAEHATPSRVRLSASSVTRRAATGLPGGLVDRAAVTVPVSRDGDVTLPTALSGRRFRVTILGTRPAREPARRLRSVAIAEVAAGSAGPRAAGAAPQGAGAAPQSAGAAPAGAGRFDSGCGAVTVAGVPTRVSGSVAELESGRALRLRGCDAVRLPAGESSVSSPPGRVFRADQVRLASPAPEPLAGGAEPRVTDPGEGWNGSRDGVRLALNGPAWLVLGESWSRGWHAYCGARHGDERDLGAPEPIDGFATGWRAPADCTRARFAFAPQRAANLAYLLSLAAVAAMLAFLLAAELRRRRAPAAAGGTSGEAPAARAWAALDAVPAPDPLLVLPWRFAVAAAVAVGLAGGFMFALRAGAVLVPLTLLALRVGVNVRRLLGVAAASIAALPVIYIVFPGRDRGGNEFGYPNDLVGAHWVALLAVLCLLGAGILLAARLRAASASGSRSST